jgi:IS605 OrfB family transposase
LRLSLTQQAAIDAAIRTTQFVRNKALRLWMDGRGVGRNELQTLCAQLPRDFPFAAALNSMARQAAADRAWQAIARFYDNCRSKKPGKKGYPRFQKDNRSVEYKTSGWRLEPDGKRLTFTDGMGIGTMRLVGTRAIETFPVGQIKRVRLVKRADGYYCQFAVAAERQVTHVPTGCTVGIDMGIATFLTDSDGDAVANPRFSHRVEGRLHRAQRQLSRRSLRHKTAKTGRKPRNNHSARQRARHNKYPKYPVALTVGLPAAPAAVFTTSMPALLATPLATPSAQHGPTPTAQQSAKQSANWHKAKRRVGTLSLHLQRQREDFARKTASALVSSHDLIALEDLQVRNLVRNRHLAKAISDVGWSRFRRWVEYYGRLHGIPVLAVPPQYTSQDCSGCGKRVRKSLSMRTHVCPHCGLILDRDHNAARMILERGLALAQEEGRWPLAGYPVH